MMHITLEVIYNGSFVKGKGNINHINREFITENVDPDRIKDNIAYVQQDLDNAFEEHFGDAIKAYLHELTINQPTKINRIIILNITNQIGLHRTKHDLVLHLRESVYE